MKVKAEEIIISHPGADFDSLASMVAAWKLYPKARMVLIAGMDIGVREFFALYRDHIPLLPLRQLDLESVQRLIITDTSKLSRLRNVKELLDNKGLEIHLYDHHVDEEGELTADFSYCLPYGSTTTILIEEIVKRAIRLTPEEATLCILGIYEDTGNLTYSTTTHDLEAAKYLLNAGANLEVVRRYISHQMGPEQKSLMQKLILNTRDMTINGLRIYFATAKITEYVDEIAFITGKIQDLENADAIFTLVEVRERVYIVGRSRIAPVNIAHILSYFGGGGHPSAGSAMVPNAQHHKVLQNLISILREELRPYITAKDIMSQPVRNIHPEATIEECREMMIRLGHSGLVVTDDEGRMSGIISRRDVDRAILSGYSQAPVKGYMQRDVVSASENTGLYQLEKLIIRHNVGRIPIVFGDRISGIVTRSDIIQAMHRMAPVGDEEMEELPIDGTLMQEDIFRSLPRHVLDILIAAGRVADRVKLPVYLVGGVVRDILMGRPCEDIDFVVEGNAAVFAETLGHELNRRTDLNMRFGTAKIHLERGSTIDIAGTRRERYSEPGALPDVEPGSIDDDLKRRDFSINSIAVRINHSTFGEFLDPFDGREDIKDGIIRILHDESFLDDPTRIFRAIRFAARFEFTIEEKTLEHMSRAIATGMLERITKQRIRDEWWLILRDSNPTGGLKMMENYGILNRVHPKLMLRDSLLGSVDPVQAVVEEYKTWDLPYAVRSHQVYLCLLMWDFTQAEVDVFALDFQLSGNDEETIRSIPGFRWEMKELAKLSEPPAPSRIYDNLYWVQIEPCLTYLVAGESLELRESVRKFIREIKPTKLEINGQDLKDLGYPPSRAYKRAFQAVFRAKIDGKISGREEELELAEEVLKDTTP